MPSWSRFSVGRWTPRATAALLRRWLYSCVPFASRALELTFPQVYVSRFRRPYSRWLLAHYPSSARQERMREHLATLPYQPLISIILPVHNTPADFLAQAIESVRRQIYPQWELCIADDASNDPRVRLTLETHCRRDQRVRVLYRQHNGHIAAASNSALSLVTGTFVAQLDHDDLLAPHALYEIVRALNERPDADMLYSDEDKIDEFNHLGEPFFKPEWSPDSFLSRMYTCHLAVFRTSVVRAIGGFREHLSGAEDYDLGRRVGASNQDVLNNEGKVARYTAQVFVGSAAIAPGALPRRSADPQYRLRRPDGNRDLHPAARVHQRGRPHEVRGEGAAVPQGERESHHHCPTAAQLSPRYGECSIYFVMAFATCVPTVLDKCRSLPVDAMISDPIFTSIHAITINAPPEQVWPWIAQMGGGRAGGTAEMRLTTWHASYKRRARVPDRYPR